MIEKALYEHLQSQTDLLEKHLATYCGKMAIFNQEAPDDHDPGWGSFGEEEYEYEDDDEVSEPESQYGRIVFALDLSDDPQRKYSGTLAVDVMCEDGAQIPEELEPIVRQLIDGYFFSEEDLTISAQWSASNYFTQPTEKVVGVTLTFGLLAFTKQTTNDPDPIALINAWTKDELDKMLGKPVRVIGCDHMESAWKPTNENPAIYWRLDNITPCGWIPDTYNCSWKTAIVYGHVLAGDKNENAKIARIIDNTLTLKKRLIFDDDAPLMVDRNIRVNLGNDQLRVGQIVLEATYGILNIPKQAEPLQNINTKERRTTNGGN